MRVRVRPAPSQHSRTVNTRCRQAKRQHRTKKKKKLTHERVVVVGVSSLSPV